MISHMIFHMTSHMINHMVCHVIYHMICTSNVWHDAKLEDIFQQFSVFLIGPYCYEVVI